MGIINIEKSVASGFSPSLVQCFMIGFPSAWVYMLLNTQKCVSKNYFSRMPSSSASPTSSGGPPGVTGNVFKDCLGTPMAVSPEADLVQSILESPLFTSGPDIKTRTATLGGYSTAVTTRSHDGVSSDANSAPQAHLDGHEQVDALKVGNHADFVLHKTKDRRKRPRSRSQSPVADIPFVGPAVAPANVSRINDSQVGASPDVAEELAPTNVSHSSGRQVCTFPDVLEEIAPVNVSHSRDCQVGASPDVDKELIPANVSHSSDRQVGGSPDVTEEKGDAEVDDESEKEDSITQKDDVDVEVNQSCKVKVECRARARRKRYKVSRNYYQRGKKKASMKSNQSKVPAGSDKPAADVKISVESTKGETDESEVVEEITEPPKKTVGRSTMSTKRNISKSASSLEVPGSSAEDSNLKGRFQTKKSSGPPLPSPSVADKSKVTQAFGLKRSLHGRLLVPPLATWRSQSIKYDTDGGIIAISDGFTASEDENCTGYYNFKPPADKGARTLRRN